VKNIKVKRCDKSPNDISTLDIATKDISKNENGKKESLKDDISKNDTLENVVSANIDDNWRTTFRKLFPLTHLRDCFRTCFKVRPNHGRAVLIALLASSLLLMIISAGFQSGSDFEPIIFVYFDYETKILKLQIYPEKVKFTVFGNFYLQICLSTMADLFWNAQYLV